MAEPSTLLGWDALASDEDDPQLLMSSSFRAMRVLVRTNVFVAVH